MVVINWYIQIGQYKLQVLDSVTITNSTEMLADTAVIALPSTTLNKTENIDDYIKRGDAVVIKAAYDSGEMQTEFVGYVHKLNIQNDGIKIECEDGLFTFRKPLTNKQFGQVTLKALCQHVVAELKLGYTLVTDFDFSYEKFTINDANGYDVLKKIQEDTKANVYVTNKELHIHAAFTEHFGAVEYNMAINIEKSDLEYKTSEDRKIQIEITCTNQKGEILKATQGSSDGEKVTIVRGSNFNEKGLNEIAKQELDRAKLDGYQGSVTGWLVPYVQSGYTAIIVDDDYPARNGQYYVKKVETSISSAGAVRKVELGKKLSDE